MEMKLMKCLLALLVFMNLSAAGLWADEFIGVSGGGTIVTPGTGGADPSYLFTFTDPSFDVARGILNADLLGHVTSGTLDVTAGQDVGTYSLIAGGPGVTNSSPVFSNCSLGGSCVYQYNNMVYPANPLAYLDTYGLLFGSGTTEVNIWGNGGSSYEFSSEMGAVQNLDHTGAFTLTATPEPMSMLLFGTFLGAAGLLRRRRIA